MKNICKNCKFWTGKNYTRYVISFYTGKTLHEIDVSPEESNEKLEFYRSHHKDVTCDGPYQYSNGGCSSPKLQYGDTEMGWIKDDKDVLIHQDNEAYSGSYIKTGPNFGCIHFTPNNEFADEDYKNFSKEELLKELDAILYPQQ